MTGRSEGLNPEAETTGTAPRNWAARHDLVLYFVLAYLLSWALWPLVILNPTSSPLVPFGPLIAAVIVALLAGGRRELWALLRQLAGASDLVRHRAARPVCPCWSYGGTGRCSRGACARDRRLHRLAGDYLLLPVDHHHRRALRGGWLARVCPSQTATSTRCH